MHEKGSCYYIYPVNFSVDFSPVQEDTYIEIYFDRIYDNLMIHGQNGLDLFFKSSTETMIICNMALDLTNSIDLFLFVLL